MSVSVSSFVVRPCWRCCFAVWLREPGGGFVSCAGAACPLCAVCSGRASLVPGVPPSCGSAAVLRVEVSPWGARRRVCVRWLRALGLPSALGLVSSSFALPFPSVLAAGARSGALSVLWSRCLAARARRRRAGLGC